mgnify:CR=1 FL=1
MLGREAAEAPGEESRAAAAKLLRPTLPYESDLARLYIGGMSEKALAVLNGCERSAIRRRLLEQGVSPRNRSAGMYVRMAQTSAADRQMLTAAAHASQRGIIRSWDDLCAKAIGRERAQKTTHGERLVAEWLRQLGLGSRPQRAIGPYNVALALDTSPVAVEIFGGNFHASGRHATRMLERTKYLLDQGWSLLIAWTNGRAFPLTSTIAQPCLTLAQLTSAAPTGQRRYWVIRGNGETAPRIAHYFNDQTFVEALGGCLQFGDEYPLSG